MHNNHNRFSFRILIILSLLFVPFATKAQQDVLFNSEQQMSSSYVKHIYQDKLGFIWVSTDNGLNRYDGYKFLTFGANDGLATDNTNCTIEDAHSNLYAGTASGLYVKLNGKFESVKNVNTEEDFPAFINDMATAPDGSVYVATSGRGVWRVCDQTHVENIIPGNGDSQYVNAVRFDAEGTLWVAAENKGILCYKPVGGVKSNKYKRIALYNINKEFSNAVLAVNNKGEILVGSMNGGVYYFDKAQRQFCVVPSTASLPVTSILKRRDNLIFVGTNGFGLKVLNVQTGELTDSYVTYRDLNLKKTKVYSIFEDRYNNIWLGLFQKGVFLHPPHSNVFNCVGVKQPDANSIGESCVMAVHRQKNGTLWVACDQDGLYGLDSNYKRIRHLEPSSNGMPSTVLFIDEDLQGRLWIGSYKEGCGWIDPVTGAYTRAPFSYGKANSIFDLRHDGKGNLWIATLGDGLKCYNTMTGSLKEYRADNNDKSIVNNFILQLAVYPEQNLVFACTALGLSCLDVTSGSWTKTFGTNVLLKGTAVNTVSYDRHNTLWLATGEGLYCYDMKKHEIVRKYTEKDGLPDNHIASIEMANDGSLWISTSRGLCHFNVKTGDVNKYYESMGLQGNEYSPGVSLFDRANNMMFFGGTNGLSYLNPSKVVTPKRDIFVTLSSILVSGERVMSSSKSGSYTICEEAVSESSHFDFCHEDNTITLSFTTLTHSSLDHITFSYSINGDDWVTLPSGQNEITMSRMHPGDYTIRIVATDNGVRSQEKTITIVIHNPWYFTPFMRIVYLLIVIAAIWWYMHLQRRRNQEQLRLQEHIHNEELNEQKLRFFINISHEIRTPMTLIVSPLLQLLKEDNDSHRQATYEIMKRNAERILHLINQILDLRKIDKGQMVMQMRETELVAFTKDALELFEPQAAGKSVTIEFDHPEEGIMAWIDRSHFDKILMNLLSNAVKYAPNGGKVKLAISDDNNGHCQFIVYNDSEPIPENAIGHLFERFYRTPVHENNNKVGTGVGLDLTRSLVQLHHGTITVQNVPGGVEFTITIPKGKDHLSEEEIAKLTDAEEKDDSSNVLTLMEEPDAKDEERLIVEEPVSAVNTSKRATVCIVEDDDEIRNYLMTELSSTYRTICYSDGAEALPNILRERPNIIVSDIMMPHMDGNTLCAKVKGNVNTNDIPFILLTAKTRDEDKLESLETGADLYVTKPFNMDILRRSIANFLNARKIMENKYTGKEEMKDQIEQLEMESVDERLLNRIMAVINANLNNSDLNIDLICSEVGISRVHLHRKMKELTNQTPHDFIRNLRLKQAARLLSRGGQSITEVMYHCGFSSATSFSTMFKKMYGMSPREYMKQHEEGK